MNDERGINFDQLTGLYSRWQQIAELQAILDARQNRVFVSIDINGFRSINERYGNAVGDRLLQTVAKALREVYSDASICRVSGDEFSFILAPTLYSRYQMCMLTRTFYDHLHKLAVEGIPEDERLTFAIGSVFIDPEHHLTPDAIYAEATELRREAKRHKGIFMHSKYGSVPDVEGAFLILRDDRRLYNKVTNALHDITDEASWLDFLNHNASVKGGMYLRNQNQLDDIRLYYSAGDLPDCEYDLLFNLVIEYASLLDAFMFDMMLGEILIPYYESLDRSDPKVCSRLGYLYVLLADALVSVVRMGDQSLQPRIVGLLNQCLDTCRDLPHSSPYFEPYFFALCELIGHFESLTQKLIPLEDCDRYYEELRSLIQGPDPVTLHDPYSLQYFDYLINNARLYPLYRASLLRLKGLQLTPAEAVEYEQRLAYIRAHLVDGVYDMANAASGQREMAVFVQKMLLNNYSDDQIMTSIITALRVVRQKEYGRFSQSNLILVAYLFLAGSRLLVSCSLSPDQKRATGIHAVDFLVELVRKREAMATDSQMTFLVRILMMAMVSSPVLTPADKYYYLRQSMSSIMIDTYCHSRAVAAYARVILANIIDRHPQLLVGEHRPYRTQEHLLANRQALLDFMDCACTLHDIGKMPLTPITSNSYRRLTDAEFALIRKHPEAGVDILSPDPAFALFHPFVYGHHCWWNGESGYPHLTLGQRQSDLTVLVDILSLCDSLEAATSRFGRTYRRPKSFLQILDEFLAESGTRYSAEVIQTIISSPDTYHELRQMVDVGWQDVYRQIFQESAAVPSVDLLSVSQRLPNLYQHSPAMSSSQTIAGSAAFAVDFPIWLRQMSLPALQVFAYSLIERNRLSVQHSDIIIFSYEVANDRMGVLRRNADGTVSHVFANHFTESRFELFSSDESNDRCIRLIADILHNPATPRQGVFNFTSAQNSRGWDLYYTCVTDRHGRILTIVGQIEDESTSRQKLLATIGRQNKYICMSEPIMDLYLVVAYTDITLNSFELLRGFPMLTGVATRLTTTRQILDYAVEHLVDPEYREGFLAFCDPATIEQRLTGKTSVSFDYHSADTGWLRATLVPADYDADNRLAHLLFLSESIEDEHQQISSLAHAAHYDVLTGLFNRMHGEEVIRQQIAQGGTQIFAILDCDNFKRINDHFSHLVGDKVLREQGRIIRSHFAGHLAMRLGGDEFVVHISGETARRLVNSFDGVSQLFSAFARQVATIRIPELGNMVPTISCGVIFTDGSVPEITFDDFYQYADEALQRSKQRRNGAISISEIRYRDYYH